jgi:hypothetical protein
VQHGKTSITVRRDQISVGQFCAVTSPHPSYYYTPVTGHITAPYARCHSDTCRLAARRATRGKARTGLAFPPPASRTARIDVLEELVSGIEAQPTHGTFRCVPLHRFLPGCHVSVFAVALLVFPALAAALTLFADLCDRLPCSFPQLPGAAVHQRVEIVMHKHNAVGAQETRRPEVHLEQLCNNTVRH